MPEIACFSSNAKQIRNKQTEILFWKIHLWINELQLEFTLRMNLNEYLFINFFKMLSPWVWKVLLCPIFLFICLVSSICLLIARVSHILIKKIPLHFLKILSESIWLFPQEFSSFGRKSSSNEWKFFSLCHKNFFL